MKYLFELLLVVLCLNVARSMPMAVPVVVPARVEVSQMPMAAVSPIEPAKPKTSKKIPLRPLARPQCAEAWDWFSTVTLIHFAVLFPLSVVLILLGVSLIAWWWGVIAAALFYLCSLLNLYIWLEHYDEVEAEMSSIGVYSIVLALILGAIALVVGLSYFITGYVVVSLVLFGTFLLCLLLLLLLVIWIMTV